MQSHPNESFDRFKAAVRAYRATNFAAVTFYLRDVERRHDRSTAEQQRAELVKYAKSDKPA